MRGSLFWFVLASCGPCPSDLPEVTWSELSGFGYEEGGALPATVLALDGQRVQLTGYLLYLGDEDDGAYLDVVTAMVDPDPLDLHFTPPRVDQTVVITSDRDNRDLWRCSVRVEGVLTVREEVDDGTVISLYRMQTERVTKLDCELAFTPEQEAVLRQRTQGAF